MTVAISEKELHALQTLSYQLRRMDVPDEARVALKAITDRALSDDGPKPADLPRIWRERAVAWFTAQDPYAPGSWEHVKKAQQEILNACAADLEAAVTRLSASDASEKPSRGVVSAVDLRTGQLTLLRAEDASHFVAGNRLYTGEDLG